MPSTPLPPRSPRPRSALLAAGRCSAVSNAVAVVSRQAHALSRRGRPRAAANNYAPLRRGGDDQSCSVCKIHQRKSAFRHTIYSWTLRHDYNANNSSRRQSGEDHGRPAGNLKRHAASAAGQRNVRFIPRDNVGTRLRGVDLPSEWCRACPLRRSLCLQHSGHQQNVWPYDL